MSVNLVQRAHDHNDTILCWKPRLSKKSAWKCSSIDHCFVLISKSPQTTREHQESNTCKSKVFIQVWSQNPQPVQYSGMCGKCWIGNCLLSWYQHEGLSKLTVTWLVDICLVIDDLCYPGGPFLETLNLDCYQYLSRTYLVLQFPFFSDPFPWAEQLFGLLFFSTCR